MRRKNIMVSILLLGGFITAFSETLLNNALPIIMKEVHVSQMTAQWLSTGYLLVAGIVMPLAAYFTNRFPLRRLFMSLMSIFLLGTLIGLFAGNYWVLLLGRLVQAAAVGVIMPLIQNVVSMLYSPEKRGLALGIAGIVINLGPAVGPTLSGYIVDHWSWRMLFIVLVPMTLVILLLAWFGVQNVTETMNDSIDVLSVVYSSIGLGSLLYSLALISANGTISISMAILLIVGIFVMTLFIRRQLKITKPLLQLKVFKAPSFTKVVIVAIFAAVAMMGPELIIPMYNQNVHQLTAMISGLLLLPGALLMAGLSPISGKMYDKFGIKRLAYIGFGLAVLATVPMLFFDNNTAKWMIMLAYAVRVSGITLVYMQLAVNGLNALPTKYVIDGSTIIVTIQQIASSFGTALLMSTTTITFKKATASGMGYTRAITQGYHNAFIVIFMITMCCLIGSFFLKNKTSQEFDA